MSLLLVLLRLAVRKLIILLKLYVLAVKEMLLLVLVGVVLSAVTVTGLLLSLVNKGLLGGAPWSSLLLDLVEFCLSVKVSCGHDEDEVASPRRLEDEGGESACGD